MSLERQVARKYLDRPCSDVGAAGRDFILTCDCGNKMLLLCTVFQRYPLVSLYEFLATLRCPKCRSLGDFTEMAEVAPPEFSDADPPPVR